MINHYPYTDIHELNLDWILKTITSLKSEINTFEAINKLKYEGIWDISKQYGIWSVVSVDNIGYLSLQNVPAGINILDSDYWLPIFDINSRIRIICLCIRAKCSYICIDSRLCLVCVVCTTADDNIFNKLLIRIT